MNLCGLEGSGFIIAIGLVLLTTGLIVYYINARLKAMQTLVDRQGAVLSQLIKDVQTHMGGANIMSTPEAEQAGLAFANQTQSGPGTSALIPVSDDDTSDSDSETDDDSDEDSDDNKGDTIQLGQDLPQVEDPKDVTVKLNDWSGLRVIETFKGQPTMASQSPEPFKDKSDSGGTSLSDDDLSEDSPTTHLIQTLDPATMEQIGHITISKLEEEDIIEVTAQEISNPIVESDIKGLRVNQLRDLAINKMNVAEEKVKSLKKPELIQLLLAES